MTISGTSSSGGINPTDTLSNFQKVKADFKALADALKFGNIKDAQDAFATLQADLPQKAQASAKSGGNANSPLAALGSALQSGDLQGAQQAFAALQVARGGHHHRHHNAAGAAGTASAPAATNDGDADDKVGANLNTLA